ncbi:MAG: peroxiredoxin family protein [Planctomycetota bacterium]
MLLILVCLMLPARSVVIGAGFDGDAEHLKQTRMPIPILPGIGSVDFRITCQHGPTQQYFNQGIALLHGDEPREADRSFYQACRIEPACPMTWWGLAAANQDNRPLAAFYIDKAVRLQEAASDREKLWINALNAYLDSGTSETDRRTFLITSLDRIVTQYPDDLEACAFLVGQFLQNREAGIPIPLTAAADLMIEHVLRHNPAHPVHHYKLLLWEGVQPERALHSAEQVPRVLPSAVRMHTAAGRVYSRMERYDDALDCFEASTAAACRRIEREHLCPAEVAGFFENAGLQMDHLAIVGRVREAVALARQLIEMPVPESPVPATTERMPAAHGLRGGGLRSLAAPPQSPATIGQQRLLGILMEHGRWQELLTLTSRNYFESTDREIQVRRMHAVGLAQFSRRDATAIAVQIEKLQQLQLNLVNSVPGVGRSILSTPIDATIRELQLCESIARNESSAHSKSIANPVLSQRLAMLFPGRTDRATAGKIARDPATRPRSAAQGLSLIRLLKSAGQTEAAVASLQDLKQQFPRMDAELTQDPEPMGSGNEDQPSATVTATPSTLCWQPPLAPLFRLPDRHGDLLSLEALRGKRVVLVFYLGAGCPHCIEQLRTLAPLKESYEQAGLTVIAISTDSVPGLQKTFQVAGAGEAIPFRLVSDFVSDEKKLTTFRDFGAFDTRDNEPLHGTFLINPQGRIVWHNIRREPFMATGALLNEARRVFSLGEAVSQTANSGVTAE